ncbi:MAG: c-type cytochrome [Planctomycetes bacterium]|nr:c-type cytochrome [Planctomycetota bacterium]
MMRFLLLSAAVLLSLSRATSAEVNPAPKLRRPTAMVAGADPRFLYVANRRSGTVSVVDLQSRLVAAETEVGETLAGMAALDDSRMLAIDESRHELILLRVEGTTVTPAERLPVSPFPVEAVIAADGRRAFVTSLWSRRLTEVALPPPGERGMAVARVIDLPFAPRKLLLTPDESRLIVADAFAGRLGVVDPDAGKLLAVREFPAHNIRGLAITPNGNMLAVAHQMLNELALSIRNDVHWGLLMSNDLRWLPLEAVLDPEAELYAGAHMHPLGEANRGGGDPADLTMTDSGLAVVPLGGANQVAIGCENDFSMRRLAVGRRPAAVATSPDGKWAYVANMFDDSISILDLEGEKVADKVSLGPQAELSLVDRGEMLFYDARLSHDRWMSCHSCHTDGHTNGMMNDNLSDASFGAPKRVLTLLGVTDTAPYAWTGHVPDVPTQIQNSIEKTMSREASATDEEVEALTAYLHTLTPPPSLDVLRGTANPSAIERGRQTFAAQQCDRCHAPPAYTSPETYDVGLTDSQGNRRFNPPSLRGVAHRGPYFHDNRAATLEDVFQVHGHQLDVELNARDLADLLAFLRSL